MQASQGGTGGSCDIAPYLAKVPRTVTDGTNHTAGNTYSMGTIVTMRSESSVYYVDHFMCMLTKCTSAPSIHIPDQWHWVEQGVWMCDIVPGWSPCTPYLKGDYIAWQDARGADGPAKP